MTGQAKSARRLFQVFLVGVFLLVAGAIYFVFRPADIRPPVEPPRGRNVFTSLSADATNASDSLSGLTWDDIALSIEGMSRDKVFREKLLSSTAQMTHAPAIYLRSLLLMAAGDNRQALEGFLRIPLPEIPPAYLYAPFRLHRALKPGLLNPFGAPLKKAVADNLVHPLIRARVWALDGYLLEALREYLKTDPAEWADLDLRVFRTLRLHAGLANDTAAMLQAALRGRRIRDAQRTEVVGMLKSSRDTVALGEMKAQFLRLMSSSDAVGAAVRAGALRQLALRQKFMLKKYRELLDEYRGMSAIQLPDETVLLLTLSAAQTKDAPDWSLWAEELLRRYPTPEVKTWLNKLAPACR